MKYWLGVLRVWNMKSGIEVFTQKDSLVTVAVSEGAPAITQLEYNKVTDQLYVITFDHNIIVHKKKDFSLTKQVTKFSTFYRINSLPTFPLTVCRLQ